jgi:hypothetical protein
MVDSRVARVLGRLLGSLTATRGKGWQIQALPGA